MADGDRRAVVYNTDERWFRHFRPEDATARVDAVNFWQPSAQTRFLSPSGSPFFFRLKSPYQAVAGFGVFAEQRFLTVAEAWDAFGGGNGDPTRERFVGRIAEYRGEHPSRVLDMRLSCLVVRDAVFLPRSRWLPWREDRGWSPNIVAFMRYDLGSLDGRALAALLAIESGDGQPPEDPAPGFVPIADDQRVLAPQLVAEREGQSAFRAGLLAAYGRRCAVTGERTEPTLDAAHIQPYRGSASDHPQNGLLLRADVHRLFDAGYLAVDPNALTVRVSGRLGRDHGFGNRYADLAGKRIAVPTEPSQRPSRLALKWHVDHVYLGD